ncbi:uncharacterized protein LOC127790260 isoform X2 [Diospyros lotus]|uniref:uncharacterized protein LOC127790260 isoform X2 n=1 Tax=Diospyros lotus TaxID=55363 RepID=UPI00224D6992|nr:uncharacterized protein LOC127790260 isoform X2 [Diospyros lotus]
MKETDTGPKDEIMEALKKDQNKILDLAPRAWYTTLDGITKLGFVQNLIERCLQHYMSQKEVENTLSAQAKIEPGFIRLVWEKLEEGNREFFNAYWLRLMVKEQIMRFNWLLEKQVEFMHRKSPTDIASLPMSNGSHLPSMHQNSACYPSDHSGPVMKADNMQQAIGSSSQNAFPIGGSSLQQCVQNAVDVSAHAGTDVSANMLLAQSSNVGMIEGINGGMIKSEGNHYSGIYPFMYGSGSDVLEASAGIGDAFVSTVGCLESISQPLNEPLLDADGSTFSFPRQIPQAFSFSDLTADFSDNILGSYSGLPVPDFDTNSFSDPHGGRGQGATQNGSWKLL